MKIKKLMGSIIATVMAVGMVGGTSVSAKVIEPEVVRTETWTTSYFIDDDVDTLYPYIQCEADIYNDGTIKVYAWNTHEWDGFATVEHTATFIEAAPVKYSDYVKGKSEKYNYNFYPDSYSISRNFSRYDSESIKTDDWFGVGVYIPQYRGFLPNMSFSEKKPNDNSWSFCGDLILKPTVEPTGAYDFKIYGHDITIIPDLLQSTSMPEPPVNETDALKAENESLKAELSALKTSYDQLSATLASQKNRAYGDMNDDGFVDARDASLLLTLYARQSVGDPITLDQLIEEQKKQ